MLRVLKLYYKVASSQLSQLPAPQIAPRTKVVPQNRQFSSSSSTDRCAYYSCTTNLPVLSLHLARLLRVLRLHYKIASSQPPPRQTTPHTKVVLQSRQFSASSSPDAVPATKSAHGGSQSAAPATKSAHGGSQSLPRNLHMEVHKALCLLRNLYMEVHKVKVLRLPRNLHMEVHKVLCLPRNLHMELHKVLRLPRNLHLEVHKALCLPRNLHMEVHKVLRLPRHLHLEVHKALRLPRNLHMEVHKVLRLPRNLHIKKQVKTLTTMEGRFEHDPTMTRHRNRRSP